MANAREFVGGKGLKAKDIGSKRIKTKILDVTIESPDKGGSKPPKLALNLQAFEGKKLFCNSTQLQELIDNVGEDTDTWPGNTIEVFTADCDYNGQQVKGIRIKVIKK